MLTIYIIYVSGYKRAKIAHRMQYYGQNHDEPVITIEQFNELLDSG